MLDQKLIYGVWHNFDSIVAKVSPACGNFCNKPQTFLPLPVFVYEELNELTVLYESSLHIVTDLVPPRALERRPSCRVVYCSNILEIYNGFFFFERFLAWIFVVFIVLFSQVAQSADESFVLFGFVAFQFIDFRSIFALHVAAGV